MEEDILLNVPPGYDVEGSELPSPSSVGSPCCAPCTVFRRE